MQPVNGSGETILVVDDDPAIIRIITTILSKSGYRIFSAVDGLECIEMTKKVKPDVILLDIDMPRMNGIEACHLLKNAPKTKDIPIVFVTGLIDDDTLKVAFDCGGTDYVCKPLNRIELLSRVKSVLAHQKLNQIRLESEKLIGVLEMAGAVCHELNQPLQTISINLEIMMNKPATDIETKRHVEDIRQQVDRMSVIMKKLMRITKYETRDYLHGAKIIDIDKASDKTK